MDSWNWGGLHSAEMRGAKAYIIFVATAHDATVIESTGKKRTLGCQLMNKVDTETQSGFAMVQEAL